MNEENYINKEFKFLLQQKYINSKDMISLIRKYKYCKNSQKKYELREEIFNNNIRLIRKIVRIIIKNNTNDIEDVFNSAVISFLIGLDKFNPNKGFKFSTYIIYWIKQGIYKELYSRDILYINRHHLSKENLEKNPEIYKSKNNSLVYLDEEKTFNDLEEKNAAVQIEDKNNINIEEFIDRERLREKILEAHEKILGIREKVIIKYKYLSEFNLESSDLVPLFKISKQSIFSIENRAMRKLRDYLNPNIMYNKNKYKNEGFINNKFDLNECYKYCDDIIEVRKINLFKNMKNSIKK